MNEVESQLQTSQEESLNEKLLRGLKKEVKHIMEESVMLKCVHEDSASITSLCLSVDACLSYGLKRRALGLFKTRYWLVYYFYSFLRRKSLIDFLPTFTYLFSYHNNDKVLSRIVV